MIIIMMAALASPRWCRPQAGTLLGIGLGPGQPGPGNRASSGWRRPAPGPARARTRNSESESAWQVGPAGEARARPGSGRFTASDCHRLAAASESEARLQVRVKLPVQATDAGGPWQ